jgi:hypothetical protein
LNYYYRSLDFLKHQKEISLKCLVSLSAAILIGILIFGLSPKGLTFLNGVNWISNHAGIRFSGYGIAYTNPISQLVEYNTSKPNCFSIEIALKPASNQKKGTSFILSLHDGRDHNQLLMWQYHSWIIFMNGDDYDHKRRTKRIAVDISSMSPTIRVITVTTGKNHTEVYLDGQLVIRKDLSLKIPNGSKTRLILGNSVYGKAPWHGDIYGLAFFGHMLTAQDAALHFDRWTHIHNFDFAAKEKPFVLYVFDEKVGKRVFDHAGGNNTLKIPYRMHMLKKKILFPSHATLKFDRGFYIDSIINFLGFIPLGFILSATFVKIGGTFEKRNLLIAVLFCFVVSLFIEIFQAWIPTRDSYILDLIFNTFGGLTGARMDSFLALRNNGKRVL